MACRRETVNLQGIAMRMLAFVEGESCTGYLAEVMREVDKKVR